MSANRRSNISMCSRPGAAQHHFATGDGAGGEVRRGLDAVGDDRVIAGVQRPVVDAMNADVDDADALDVGTHRRQELAEIGDLRLARGVVDTVVPFGVHRRGQDVLGRADAGEVEA